MIFDIKQEDLRHKARLVVGGHLVDSSAYNTYSSCVENISVCLLMLVAAQQRLSVMTGDIATAFVTAPATEKVYTIAGPEFGDKQGSKVLIKRALYGLAASSRAYHEFFADTLRRMGFTPTRADQDLWYKKSKDHDGYDYIATHVDDIAIAAKRPSEYMSLIEQEFTVRNKTESPSYYLGNDLKDKKGKLHISNEKYIKEMLRKHQDKHGSLKKQNIPMPTKTHPELDDSPLLNDDKTREYQQIVGVGQWLVVAGRLDITHAIASLSRFSSAPREGHLELAKHLLGYLKKYPRLGYTVNPAPPSIDHDYQQVELKQDFGNQYAYFNEDLDPRFPVALVPELDINIFVDADHGHDKVTGRSITGLVAFVGSTPVTWSSKRQLQVQTSAFSAEFAALKRATEEAMTLRHYLCAMGVKVSKPTPIFVDNMSVVLNASNPGSTLNKKWVALSYHFVREHAANDIVSIRKIDTSDNYADPFTKALNSKEHFDFFYEYMTN